MQIRTKLVLVFTFVFGTALLAAGVLIFEGARSTLIDKGHAQLASIAQLNRYNLENLLNGNLRVLGSISSKWQLRRSLRDYIDGDRNTRTVMEKILIATLQRDRQLRSITIYDHNSRLVVTAGARVKGQRPERLAEIYWPQPGRPALKMADELRIEERHLGHVVMEVWGSDITRLQRDQTGLGQTGELLLLRKTPSGDAEFIMPTRFDPVAANGRLVSRENRFSPEIIALAGQGGMHSELLDYRGHSVLAVTDFIPGVEWGMVVKMDMAEVVEPARQLRNTFIAIISLAALLAGLAAFLLTRRIIQPLQQLAESARRIREGETIELPHSTGTDEVGALSESLHLLVEKIREKGILLNNVLSLAPAMIFLKDKEGRYLLANDRMAGMYGETPDSIIGKRQSDLHPVAAELTSFRQHDERTTDSGRSHEILRENFTDIHGETHVIHSQKIPFDYEGQQVVLGVGLDVTSLVAAEDEAQRALIEAQTATAAGAAKARFLANMSHEIRTPMNSILGFMELAMENDIPDHAHRQLGIAHRSARSLLRIINDILDVAKLDSGQFHIEKVPFSLRTELKDSLRALEIQCDEKRLGMSLDVAPDLAETWMGDPVRLRQILTNLVGNAIKFTDKGTISVTVTARKDAPGISIAVRDTGIGIPAAQIREMFQPFSQVDSSVTRRHGGTGLGLTICRQLAILMGGGIAVESKEKEGSTFTCTLALEPTEETVSAEPKPTGLSLVTDHPLNLLLAEDISENVELAVARLEEKGHKVTVARDGFEAVEAFARESYDAVLMDIQMPRMDGLSATFKIRDTEAQEGLGHTPIIAMTASVMQDEQAEYIKAGMDAFVAKPVDFPELFQLLARITNRPTSLRSPAPKARKAFPTFPGIDYEKGLDRCGSEELYHNMLSSFAESYSHMGELIQNQLAGTDFKEVHMSAHTLKGLAGNLSITHVEEICGHLTRAAKVEDRDTCHKHSMQLAAAMQDALSDIDRILQQEKPVRG